MVAAHLELTAIMNVISSGRRFYRSGRPASLSIEEVSHE